MKEENMKIEEEMEKGIKAFGEVVGKKLKEENEKIDKIAKDEKTAIVMKTFNAIAWAVILYFVVDTVYEAMLKKEIQKAKEEKEKVEKLDVKR